MGADTPSSMQRDAVPLPAKLWNPRRLDSSGDELLKVHRCKKTVLRLQRPHQTLRQWRRTRSYVEEASEQACLAAGSGLKDLR